MKLEPGNLEHRYLHDLIGSITVPKPIALISTVGENGVYNAAPYSLVIPVCWKPPVMMASIGRRRGQKKDTLRNIEFTRDFVMNIMDDSRLQQTVQTSADYPYGVDEMKEVGFTAVASDKVKSPRIAEAQFSLECRVLQQLEFGALPDVRNVVFGEVLVIHIKDELWVDGMVDHAKVRAVGRLGSGVYCRTRDIIRLPGAKVPERRG